MELPKEISDDLSTYLEIARLALAEGLSVDQQSVLDLNSDELNRLALQLTHFMGKVTA